MFDKMIINPLTIVIHQKIFLATNGHAHVLRGHVPNEILEEFRESWCQMSRVPLSQLQLVTPVLTDQKSSN